MTSDLQLVIDLADKTLRIDFCVSSRDKIARAKVSGELLFSDHQWNSLAYATERKALPLTDTYVSRSGRESADFQPLTRNHEGKDNGRSKRPSFDRGSKRDRRANRHGWEHVDARDEERTMERKDAFSLRRFLLLRTWTVRVPCRFSASRFPARRETTHGTDTRDDEQWEAHHVRPKQDRSRELITRLRMGKKTLTKARALVSGWEFNGACVHTCEKPLARLLVAINE